MQYITPPKTNHTPLYDAVAADHVPAYAMPAGAAPCYDIAGNLLFQHSMDAGDRWTLNDAAGTPMLAWDYNERTSDDGSVVAEHRRFDLRYDALHRPVEHWLTINSAAPALIEAFGYADTAALTSVAAVSAAQAQNLVGLATAHYDASGLGTVVRADAAGAVEEITRTLVLDVEAPLVDWNVTDRDALLELETFIQITEHDALGRTTTSYNWHRDVDLQPGHSDRVAVYVPVYNQRGVLQSETLHVQATKHPGADGRPAFTPHADVKKNLQAIKDVAWDAKGQKLKLELGNGTTTRYAYDPATFRLVHLVTERVTSSVQDLRFTYDPVGNITHIQDDAQDTIFFANQQVEPSSDYVYDALYRLIEATGRENAAAVGPPAQPEGNWPSGVFPSPESTRNYTQRYRYDAVGNVLTMQHSAPTFPGQLAGGWTRDYAYAFDDPTQPASNRLWQTWEGGTRSKAVTYRHDPHGSMLNLAATAPGVDVRWDWRDMIRALDLGGGGNAFYNYGADKQRTRKHLKRIGGATEDRIYLGGYELYRRRDAQGTVVEEIDSLHLFEGEQRVLLVDDVLISTGRADTLLRFQYSDHLGSVGVELDDAARLISYEESHPFGTCAYRLTNTVVEVPVKRYRHTGMERDDESGLSYRKSRFYDGSLGRWVSFDPAFPVDGVDGYVAMRNAPTTVRDPSGEVGEPGVGGGGPPVRPPYPFKVPEWRSPEAFRPPTLRPPLSPPTISTPPPVPVALAPEAAGAGLAPLAGLGLLLGLVAWGAFAVELISTTDRKFKGLAEELNRGTVPRIQDGAPRMDLPPDPSGSGPKSAPSSTAPSGTIGDSPASPSERREAPGEELSRNIVFPPAEIVGDLKLGGPDANPHTVTSTVFHGASGDKILSILESGELRPSGGQVFVGSYERAPSYMHGADRTRKASFVLELEIIYDPSKVATERKSTSGVPNTLVLTTEMPLSIRALRMFERRMGEDGMVERIYTGEAEIRAGLLGRSVSGSEKPGFLP